MHIDVEARVINILWWLQACGVYPGNLGTLPDGLRGYVSSLRGEPCYFEGLRTQAFKYKAV